MLWDTLTSASYQSPSKEALSRWKKHIFQPEYLPRETFRLDLRDDCHGAGYCLTGNGLSGCQEQNRVLEVQHGRAGPAVSPKPGPCTRVWDRDVPVTQPSEVHRLVTSGWKLSIGLAPVPETWFWLGFLTCFLGGRDWLSFGGLGFFCHSCPPGFLSPSAGMRSPGARAGGGENGKKMLKQVMGESWELGTDELIKKRGFIYCNPDASPTLTGFLMQSILTFISNLGLFQEISPSASPEPTSRCFLTLRLKANPQPAAAERVRGFTGIHPPWQPDRPEGVYAFRISCDS